MTSREFRVERMDNPDRQPNQVLGTDGNALFPGALASAIAWVTL
jgi:hypothetical protein